MPKGDKTKSGKENPTFKDRTGEIHTTNEGYKVRIIEYFRASDCTIQFKDNKNTIMYKMHYKAIKEGKVRNPNHPAHCGIGYIGQGIYTSSLDGKLTKAYNNWRGILKRCYYKKWKDNLKTYDDCLISLEWENFQNFAKWHEESYNSDIMKGWHLDKDILIKGNKIYSPETCCFVPAEINMLFVKNDKRRGTTSIGVYFNPVNNRYTAVINIDAKNKHIGCFKTNREAFEAYKFAKEAHIKGVADKWKLLIRPEVYDVLINYKVEIND